MSYRTIKIDWLPKSGKHWKIFTAARLEAGRLVHNASTVMRQRDTKAGGGQPKPNCTRRSNASSLPCTRNRHNRIVADFCEAIASQKRCARIVRPTHIRTRNRAIIR